MGQGYTRGSSNTDIREIGNLFFVFFFYQPSYKRKIETGTHNPFVMECHPTDYHPKLIRNILIIIWLKPKRCNSFNFPFIRGEVEKKCKLPISRMSAFDDPRGYP